MGIGKKILAFAGVCGMVFCVGKQNPAAAENTYALSAENEAIAGENLQSASRDVITRLQVGSVVEKGGTYRIDPEAVDGEIYVRTTEDVTLTGSGVGKLRNAYLTIVAEVPRVHITIEGIDIRNATAKPVNTMRFTGTGNRLTVKGINYFGECIQEANIRSVINVAKGAALTIDGDGVLFVSTHSSNAAAIGGDTNQDSGKIVFDGATVLIDTFMGGMAVGSDARAGEILFKSGEVGIYGTNSYRSQLGSRTNQTGQNITFSGGIVTLYNQSCCPMGADGKYQGTAVLEGGLLLDSSESPVDSLLKDREGNPLYRCPLELPRDAEQYKVDVDGKTYYEGDGLVWSDTDINEEAFNKWQQVSMLDQAYVYLSGKKHRITINGEDYTAGFDAASHTFTLEEGWVPEASIPAETPGEVPETPGITEIPESPEPTQAPESPAVTEIPESPKPTQDPKPPEVTDVPEKPSPTDIAVPVGSIKLNRTEWKLTVGERETLTAVVSPENAADKTVSYSSSDPQIVQVDEKSGELIAVREGTAVITVSAAGGDHITASCTITVEKQKDNPPQTPAPATAVVKLGKARLTLYTKGSRSQVLKVSVNGKMLPGIRWNGALPGQEWPQWTKTAECQPGKKERPPSQPVSMGEKHLAVSQ